MKKTLYLTLTLLLGAALYACNPERPGGEEEETGGLLTADPIEWDGTKNALVAAAHGRDIKIYIDYVLNHSSKDHPWFLDAKEHEDSPYRDFYIFSDNPRADIEAGRIPMINTEGAGGYDASQWYVAGNAAVGTMEFVLDWTDPDAPTVTGAGRPGEYRSGYGQRQVPLPGRPRPSREVLR